MREDTLAEREGSPVWQHVATLWFPFDCLPQSCILWPMPLLELTAARLAICVALWGVGVGIQSVSLPGACHCVLGPRSPSVPAFMVPGQQLGRSVGWVYFLFLNTQPHN